MPPAQRATQRATQRARQRATQRRDRQHGPTQRDQHRGQATQRTGNTEDRQFCSAILLRAILLPGLKRIEDENQRYDHLRDGIQYTTGVRLPVKLLAMEERRPDGSKEDFLISEDQWESLKPLVLARIEAAAGDGRLRRQEGLSYLLWRWKEWAGEDVVKKWVAAELEAF